MQIRLNSILLRIERRDNLIGLCCQWAEEKKKRDGSIELKNLYGERNLQLGRFNLHHYSDEDIVSTWRINVDSLFQMLQRAHREGFRHVRISSNLLPLWDKVQHLQNDQDLLTRLSSLGRWIGERGMRITQHPDQFCVLSSLSDQVVANSVEILKRHAFVADALSLPSSPFSAINIHGGKGGEGERLKRGIESLPQSVRDRLTLENDESAYSVADLLPISLATGVPIVLDSHHHSFNTGGLSLEEAVDRSAETWRRGKVLQHLSNSQPEAKGKGFLAERKHSQYVHYIPEIQKDLLNRNEVDIEFEFKAKNLAIEKAVVEFGLKLAGD